jgi:hypothetical protein
MTPPPPAITQPAPLTSPDGAISVTFSLSDGQPHYAVSFHNQPLLQPSRLGLVREDADFSKNLTLLGISPVESVTDHYQLVTGKRRDITYSANRQTFHLQNPTAPQDAQHLDILFQVSNDGLAFRYIFPEVPLKTRLPITHTIQQELTSFHFLPKTTAFLQPMQVAKSGWESSNPAYEEFYQKEIPIGTPSTLGAGWVFPALFHSGDRWMAITEASVGRSWCGCHLADQSPGGEYTIALADPRETIGNQPAAPHSFLPWKSPWRILAIGSLKTLTESTLGTDLADPPAPALAAACAAFVKPGLASWSWPLMGDKNTTFDVQKKFIDYAADMHWPYCLIDALWDTQIGDQRMKQLCAYAATKNVGILLWYNSRGDWNTTPQTPRDKLLTHASRLAEFTKLRNWGVKGIKVDFFGGDGQPFINYYQDILTDAAPFHLMVNFHGATLPRGLERTYPNLLTMEAIRGFEYITFEQANADQEPTHAAMLPFTRNLFDPMDFTPVCLDKINDRVTRRTTPGFELALAVLFTSGIQHIPETPEGMATQPDYVRAFMRNFPAAWDDTRFLAGYPGKYVVLARKARNTWYLAGINGQETPQEIVMDLRPLTIAGTGHLIGDNDSGQLMQADIPPESVATQYTLTLQPHAGFVATYPSKP